MCNLKKSNIATETALCFLRDQIPGMKKYGNITMKKASSKGDNKFWDWLNQIKMNTIKRVPVTISLLDEQGNDTMVWDLTNATANQDLKH